MSNQNEIQEALEQYSEFVVQLREKISSLESSRSSFESEVRDYSQFQTTYNYLLKQKEENPTSNYVKKFSNIGDNLYVQTRINKNDLKTPFIHIGLGFHVEINENDVDRIIQTRQDILRRKIDSLSEELYVTVKDLEETTAVLETLEEMAKN